MWPTQTGNAALAGTGSGVWLRGLHAGYLAILCVRSPSALLADSIFSPPLLSRMPTKVRTRTPLPLGDGHDLSPRCAFDALHQGDHLTFPCCCGPHSCRRRFSWRVRPASRAWPSWRVCGWPWSCGAPGSGVVVLSDRLCSCSWRYPRPGCGRHIDHSGPEKLQAKFSAISPGTERCAAVRQSGGRRSLFYGPDKTMAIHIRPIRSGGLSHGTRCIGPLIHEVRDISDLEQP